MVHIPTVTVGIPAYNEERNIASIVTAILSQKERGFRIEKIIIASDGSTDKTIPIVRSFQDPRIEVIEGTENKGQNYRQNEIISRCESDILVLFNGDIILADDFVIGALISYIAAGEADLTSQWPKPVPPRKFFEKVLFAGYVFKHHVYTHLRDGNNIYTSIGAMRALSRRFYSRVQFPRTSEGEDQFLYLTCIAQGCIYKSVRSINARFLLPSNFKEYLIYARRIFQTQYKNETILGTERTLRERNLPKSLILKGLMHALKKYPVYTVLYCVMHCTVQLWAVRQPQSTTHTFARLESTKGATV